MKSASYFLDHASQAGFQVPASEFAFKTKQETKTQSDTINHITINTINPKKGEKRL